jgi:hypothetical protein
VSDPEAVAGRQFRPGALDGAAVVERPTLTVTVVDESIPHRVVSVEDGRSGRPRGPRA